MLGQNFFYHQSIKKYIVALSHIFNNIHIQRSTSEGTLIKDVKIPLSYGQKQKLFNILERNTTIDRRIDTFLPRIDFEMTGLTPDPTRQKNVVREIDVANGNDFNSTFNGVAYNFNFEVNLICKYLDDMYQALEQILSLTTPDYQNLTVSLIPSLGISHNVKVVLNDVQTEVNTDMGEDDFRSCEATLDFTLQGYLYKPIATDGKVINSVIIDLNDYDTDETYSILTAGLE